MQGLVKGEDGAVRCMWGGSTADYIPYHDDEWGRPVDNDHRLFEKICLEGFQSGLSWLTILRKRENFRAAFAGFDFNRIAEFGEKDVERLLADTGIVRHRGKIVSTINNAKRAQELVAEAGAPAGRAAPEPPPPERAATAETTETATQRRGRSRPGSGRSSRARISVQRRLIFRHCAPTPPRRFRHAFQRS